jgi:indole-3-glycerol phosphate synthase
VTYVTSGTILDKILARTVADVEVRKRNQPISDLERMAHDRPAPVSLRQSLARPGMAVIAEIKRASPSRGLLVEVVEAADIAGQYVAGGAAAISVLTDEPFFRGSLEDMDQAANIAHAATPPIPILRKDFIIDSFQIVEARAHGADAILLIVAALEDRALTDLFESAMGWGLDALVEVHDEQELARAVALGATVLGINNRDLRTFTVDLATTERLAPLAPEGTVVVAESGVFGPQEILRLARAGADAVLVGEGLITASDRAAAVRTLWSSLE